MEKKEISIVKKLPLEFLEAMWRNMNAWHGQRKIYASTMQVVDTDQRPPRAQNRFGRNAASASATSQPVSASHVVPGAMNPPSGLGSVIPPPFAPATSQLASGSNVPEILPSSDPAPMDAELVPGDRTPGSSGRLKRKCCGTDNLVDFVKDFNNVYLDRVEAEDADRKAWRLNMLQQETHREACMAEKDANALRMEEKAYELELQRTRM